eukprot:45774_1
MSCQEGPSSRLGTLLVSPVNVPPREEILSGHREYLRCGKPAVNQHKCTHKRKITKRKEVAKRATVGSLKKRLKKRLGHTDKRNVPAKWATFIRQSEDMMNIDGITPPTEDMLTDLSAVPTDAASSGTQITNLASTNLASSPAPAPNFGMEPPSHQQFLRRVSVEDSAKHS